jgi:hypothetical protein
MDFILPHLRSKDPVLLGGAVIGARSLLSANPPLLSDAARGRAEETFISASENVLLTGDGQTKNDFASTLGSLHDPRARDVLWTFVDRNVVIEASLIAITWFKNPADLPRFATLLEAPAKGDPKDRTYASLPYAIRRAYGDAALPVLESAIQKSGYVFVQTNCARELVEAGRKSGFAFIAQAIEQNLFCRAEMVRFLQGRFPELRGAGDGQVLEFLKTRE